MTATPILQFDLAWIDSVGNERARTIARFSVSVGGRTVWPAINEPDVAVEIHADDLLSHLVEFWKPLMLRQTYPIRVAPDRPSRLRALAEARWAEMPAAVAEREEDIVIAFEDAHDVSNAFAGHFGLPPLFMLRQGDSLVIDTRDGCWNVGFAGAVLSLGDLGERIASRLGTLPGRKWEALLEFWASRNQGDPARILAWATSLDPHLARTLIDEGTLRAPGSVAEAANDDDELRLAARMSGALPPDQIRRILDLVRNLEPREAKPLDRLAEATLRHVTDRSGHLKPFEQGQVAATFVRDRYRFAPAQRIDVFALIAELGAEMHQPSVEPQGLDGLAVCVRCTGRRCW